jgi:hypothetical protein
MKRVLTIVGVLLMLAGGVWILQGVGILPGSFMSGQMQWAYNGTVTALMGAGLLVFAYRPRRKTPPQ